MNLNKEQTQQKNQSGGYKFTQSRSKSNSHSNSRSNSRSTKRNSTSRDKSNPFKNPAELQRIMSLFQ